MEWFLLVVALLVILVGAESFTNGVEWVGEGFGLSEGAVGSVLAAIGTALPETLVPLIAILSGHAGGKEVGVGAILGAPLMLSTLAMFAMGVTVVVVAAKGKRSRELEHDAGVLQQDLGYFMVMYTLAFAVGLVPSRPLHYALAVVLLIGYGFYVRRHFKAPGEKQQEAEAVGEVKRLYLSRLGGRRGADKPVGQPPRWMSVTQTLLGLGILLIGAELFVNVITKLSATLGVPHLAFALLIAPVATELPEALNASVIWARRGKDVLAVGNITGAMVFQATFPVAIGLTLTPWHLDLIAGVSAVVALVASMVLFLTAKIRGRLSGPLLLLQGIFYVGFVAFVLTRI